MSLAERLSSKFHICPRSFASRPNVHFSDNLSARGHYRPIYQPPEGVYLLNIPQFLKWIINTITSIWLGKKARIFVLGHYLFLEAQSFPRASLSENCSLLGTDNVRGQVSEHIFAPNEGYCLFIPENRKETTLSCCRNKCCFLIVWQSRYINLLNTIHRLKCYQSTLLFQCQCSSLKMNTKSFKLNHVVKYKNKKTKKRNR